METKVIHIEVRFTPTALALLAGLALLLGALLVLLWTAGVAVADPGGQNSAEPQQVTGLAAIVGAEIHYQGRLEGATGPVTMTFRLWDDPTSTTAVHQLWTETKTVSPTNGLFNTQLGDTNPLNPVYFDGRELWLGVEVADDGEMVPRQEILPVPYAMSLRPRARIVDEDTPAWTLYVENGNPFFITKLDKRSIVGVTTDGIGVSGRAGTGIGVSGYSVDGVAIFGDSTSGWAGSFNGDVGQNLAGNGLVKAAIYANCYGDESTRVRYFNNVNNSEITVSGPALDGMCEINFNFDLSGRYWVTTAMGSGGRLVNCSLDPGNTALECIRRNTDSDRENGPIMVLVY